MGWAGGPAHEKALRKENCGALKHSQVASKGEVDVDKVKGHNKTDLSL